MQVTLPHLLARHQLIPKTHCHLHTSGLVVDNNLINCNIIIIIIVVVIIIINEFQSDFQCPGNFFPAEVKRIPCYRKLTLNSFLRKKSQPGEPNTFLRICHNHIRVTQIHIQMLKYTNTQIHKYSNTQIHKYTNTQIYKYTSTFQQKKVNPNTFLRIFHNRIRVTQSLQEVPRDQI